MPAHSPESPAVLPTEPSPDGQRDGAANVFSGDPERKERVVVVFTPPPDEDRR